MPPKQEKNAEAHSKVEEEEDAAEVSEAEEEKRIEGVPD